MPRVGFEPTIPVFERAKTVHELDFAATVIDDVSYNHVISMHPVNNGDEGSCKQGQTQGLTQC
jgi:hypothetical protein